jgi:hypothetical protein
MSGEAACPPLAFGPQAPLVEIMRTTRSMRCLKPDPVDRGLLCQLVEAATWGPTDALWQLTPTAHRKMRERPRVDEFQITPDVPAQVQTVA